MPEYNEEELRKKLKEIEEATEIKEFSFWFSVFKKVALVFFFFLIAILGKVLSRYLSS